MKRILLFSLAICVAASLFAQKVVKFDPDPNVTVVEEADLPFEIVAYGHMINNTGNDVTIEWFRDYAEGPQEWESLICDKNKCWNISVGNETVELLNGEEATLDVHVRPFEVQGCGRYLIHILSEDLTDTLAVGEYLFQLGDNPGCELAVSTSVPGLELNLKLSPNPVSNGFYLQGNQQASEVQIFNLVGVPVKRFPVQPSGFYQVGDLSSGIYLVQALDDSGRALKTVRMVKK